MSALPEGAATLVRLRADAVAWRSVDDDIAALDLAAGEYFAVNAAGAALWPLLVRGATIAELAGELASRFPVPPDRAVADVEAFVGALRDRDLLQPAGVA